MPASPEKSQAAFRTIREVADWLGVPTHVLRFWESKFDQIAPVKGAGGRRYYRPEDMRLLGGIKVLLHDDGLTIRAVAQRIEEGGVEPIRELSPELATDEPTPAPRTRRVIRKGDGMDGRDSAAKAPAPKAPAPPGSTPAMDEATRSDAPETHDEPAPSPVEEARDEAPPPSAPPVPIAKEPVSPLEETLPDQPEDPGATEAAPAPPEPSTVSPEPTPSEVPLDPQVPQDPPAELPAAPADPPEQVRHAPEPDPDPAAEPTTPPPPAPEDPAESTPASPVAAPDPLARARALARAAAPLDPFDRKRLRRLVRRYRALAEEIAEDLSEGSSP